MRKSRFTEEQIVGIIQEYATGAKVSELCRRHGMSGKRQDKVMGAQLHTGDHAKRFAKACPRT